LLKDQTKASEAKIFAKNEKNRSEEDMSDMMMLMMRREENCMDYES